MNARRKIPLLIIAATLLTACGTHKRALTSEEYILLELMELDKQRIRATPNPTQADALLAEAYTWVGTPYRYGGQSRSGADCSGFVMQVYLKTLGIKLPRSSREQAQQGRRVKRSELRPGDLVFFAIGRGSTVNHVGIYAGNNMMIHASASRGVMLATFTDPYFTRHYHSARRLL